MKNSCKRYTNNMVVPFFDSKRQLTKIRKEIDKATKNVLDTGWYVLGKEVENFENNFAKYIGVKYGIGVNSGTDAIKIALKSLGVSAEDEIITVSNTATPTVSAIREIGAIPVFIDIDDFFTIDSKKIEEKINKKTKAIIAVHLYGGCSEIDKIKSIAKKNKLALIEDCAQSTGAEFKNKKLGSFGDISCFSFYPTKNLGAYGDGGMILTNDSRLAKTSRSLRMYGMEKTYFSNIEGFNSRLDEIQAAILSVKLKHLDDWNKKRIEIASYYSKNIKNSLVEIPRVRKNSKHVFHLFVIKTEKRDELMNYFSNYGIQTKIHYPFPVHQQKAYEFLKVKNLPLTEKISKQILSLPMFPEITKEELSFVVQKINEFK